MEKEEKNDELHKQFIELQNLEQDLAIKTTIINRLKEDIVKKKDEIKKKLKEGDLKYDFEGERYFVTQRKGGLKVADEGLVIEWAKDNEIDGLIETVEKLKTKEYLKYIDLKIANKEMLRDKIPGIEWKEGVEYLGKRKIKK